VWTSARLLFLFVFVIGWKISQFYKSRARAPWRQSCHFLGYEGIVTTLPHRCGDLSDNNG